MGNFLLKPSHHNYMLACQLSVSSYENIRLIIHNDVYEIFHKKLIRVETQQQLRDLLVNTTAHCRKHLFHKPTRP